jgi:hypothetical protein
MITKPNTFRKLIEQLGGVKPFAAKMGLPPNTAKMMRDRNSVAVEHWPLLIDVAREDGLLLTTDDFVNMKLARPIPSQGKAA